MRTISKRMWKQTRQSAKGDKYDLYCYQLDDGDEIESTEVFKDGEEVTTWYDHKYNKAKIRRKR